MYKAVTSKGILTGMEGDALSTDTEKTGNERLIG
jgi:hypothetical protein